MDAAGSVGSVFDTIQGDESEEIMAWFISIVGPLVNPGKIWGNAQQLFKKMIECLKALDISGFVKTIADSLVSFGLFES